MRAAVTYTSVRVLTNYLTPQCSTTCGRGVKTRRVTCAHVSNGTVLDNEACVKAGGKRPRHIARCIEQRRCPKWKAGPWSQVHTYIEKTRLLKLFNHMIG